MISNKPCTCVTYLVNVHARITALVSGEVAVMVDAIGAEAVMLL